MSLSARRAWIEIDSDFSAPATSMESLSARRAWIEIFQWAHIRSAPRVALRKESVDRNILSKGVDYMASVALRKESVDRNNNITIAQFFSLSRSPQGERG